MSEIFIQIIFAHIIGDYFFQPKWMATKKDSSDFVCLIHCMIVTLFALLFVTINWKWGVFTFISHFIIDRFSLADAWLKLIGGRALTEFISNGHFLIPNKHPFFDGYLKSDEDNKLNYRILRGSFSGIVYVIVDAGMHLIPAFYFYKYFIL